MCATPAVCAHVLHVCMRPQAVLLLESIHIVKKMRGFSLFPCLFGVYHVAIACPTASAEVSAFSSPSLLFPFPEPQITVLNPHSLDLPHLPAAPLLLSALSDKRKRRLAMDSLPKVSALITQGQRINNPRSVH